MSQSLAAQVGFGIELPTNNKFGTTWKPEQGKVYRVAIAWIENNTPQMIHAQCHYVQGLGNIKHQPGFDKLTKKQPTTRVGTVVFVFRTDNEGELLRDDQDKPILSGWEVHPWCMSALKYDELRKLHKKWDLAKHDLSIECTDAQYMKLVIQPHSESVFQKMLVSKQWGEKIKSAIAEKIEQVKNMLAREVSEEQLREALGMTSTQEVPEIGDEVISSLDDEFVSMK